MAKKLILLGAVVTALAFASCASYSTVSGVRTPLGIYTSDKVNEKRAKPIAEYGIILGMFTTGYEEFLTKIKGQEVDIIDTNYFGFYQTVKAVQSNR